MARIPYMPRRGSRKKQSEGSDESAREEVQMTEDEAASPAGARLQPRPVRGRRRWACLMCHIPEFGRSGA